MNTKEKIIKAAAIEFARQGYRNTTIRGLCRKAEVNVALINYHFKGKEGLYKAVVDHLFNEIDSVIKIQFDYKNEEEWFEGLYNWILTFIKKGTDDSPKRAQLHKILSKEVAEPTALFHEFYQKYFHNFLEDLHDMILYKVKDTKDEEFINIIVFSVISQCVFIVQNRALISEVLDVKDFLKSKLKIENIAKNITEEIYLTIINHN